MFALRVNPPCASYPNSAAELVEPRSAHHGFHTHDRTHKVCQTPLPGPELACIFDDACLSVFAKPTRTDQELAVSIKKATSPEEISPKRKHVRACIVYTWDHRSSQAFWAGMKV